MEWLVELLKNEYFVWGAMAVIVFAVTQGLKWLFVKPFTKKLNDKAKNIINSVILIIALGAAIGVEFLYSHFFLQETINITRALGGWGGASTVYAVFERFIKIFSGKEVDLGNPYTTEVGKETVELVEEVAKDGKVDANDKPAVESYLEMLNK